jgi:putative pyruvate formate lyase activating enzyme
LLAREVSRHTWLNVMSQYRPCGRAGEYPEIARRLSVAEFRQALQIAAEEGLSLRS